MDEQVVWFEWKRDEPIDLPGIRQAVIDGGMGVSEFRLLGRFQFGEGWAQLQGDQSPRLSYGGEVLANGIWDIEIAGYEPGATPRVYRIREYAQPKQYQ